MEKPHRKLFGGNADIALLLLSIAIVLIVVGVFNGEMAVILRKATLICLECIGLG